MLSDATLFIRKNYIQIIILAVILIIAAFFRIYKIQDYLTFLGDEGRDVLIVRDILHGHFTLLGPRASAGDFFTGPIYYYMMAPFLFLANYNPVGPAIMIALLSVITTYMIYEFGRRWFNPTAALIAAALYAISPLVIQYSRSSWNPNPMPFFSMVIFYLLYRWIQKPTVPKFAIIGILYGIAFQLHYIEIFVGVIIFLYVLIGNIFIGKKDLIVRLGREYIAILVGFLIGLSPFLAFEARHGFPNVKTVINFIVHGDTTATDLTHSTFIQTVGDIFFRSFARLVMYFPPPERMYVYAKAIPYWYWGAIILGIFSTTFLVFQFVESARSKKRDFLKYLLILLWFSFGVILFGFYRKPIYDYYFEFMFPVPFLLVGNLLSYFWLQKIFYKLVAALIFVVLIYLNLLGYPYAAPGNQQYIQVKKISEFILQKTENKPFNFALLTLGNSDHAYRYIFEVDGHPPVTIQYTGIDPERKSVTNQLFVVCEDPNCEPLGASLWEVAGFGRAEIAAEWPVSVLKVYKLVHYKESPKPVFVNHISPRK